MGAHGKWQARGVRVIYFHMVAGQVVLLVMVYAKAARANVKAGDIERS